MQTIQELVQEMEQEAAATRKVLARIPDGRMGWAPHEKSMTLGQLAAHIATLPALIADMSTWPAFDVKTSNEKIQASRPSAESAADALAMLDRSIAEATARLTALGDDGLGTPWKMVRGERDLGSMPVAALFRSALLNHWYHHRGQMTVYLRLNGVSVPAIYGDSADERAFVE